MGLIRESYGKVIRFSDLDLKLQRSFCAPAEWLEEHGLRLYANPMSRARIVSLGTFITLSTTAGLFICAVVCTDASYTDILTFLGIWFLSISLFMLIWLYPKYKKTAKKSGILVTDTDLIFYRNNDLVFVLPLETLVIYEGRTGWVFKSGYARFTIERAYAVGDEFNSFFNEICIKRPQFKHLIPMSG